jgi:CRP-like cAMP-binding protein
MNALTSHTMQRRAASDFVNARSLERGNTLSKLAGRSTVLNLLPEEELCALLQRSVVRRLGGREVIFRRADQGGTVIVILEGYVKLSSTTVCGREVVLEIAGPGTCLGELSVLDDLPRNADATTITASRLLLMDSREFRRTMERNPLGTLAIFRLNSERLRAATQQVLDFVTLPAPARIAKTLLQLAATHSHETLDGSCIDLRLSQSELGGIAGLTRECVNKYLSVWHDNGWIRQSKEGVTLLNVVALEDLVHEHEL